MVEQTSASDRYEAARKALAAAAMYGVAPGMSAQREAQMVLDLVDALRALIAPPNVSESVEQIAANIERVYGGRLSQETLLQMAVRAGIQSAHETWEPEVAQRPSQEQMLRWLGVEHDLDEAVGMLFIQAQYIEREEA